MDYKIVKYPDPILRQESLEIKDPTSPEIQQLVLDMIKTLRANEGLGLAAPQIGKSLQLCVIEIEHEIFTLINPKIKKLSGDEIVSEEGCLSFPGKFLPVKRFDKIKVSAIDSNGKKQIIRARGLLSRAIQHEVDHLHGYLFIDRAIPAR